MRRNVVLAGVGGQGLLSIAAVLGEEARAEGLHLKQAEVHGMLFGRSLTQTVQFLQLPKL